MSVPRLERLGAGPLITPHMDARMGGNVNGPSLIKVPDWIPHPLGRYYLYFAHHDGRYIRLAYADAVTGPWRTHEPGVLPLADSHFKGHLASPDVHVDHHRRQIRMYFHGADFASGTADGPQLSRAAASADGLAFSAGEEILAASYLRVVSHGDGYLGLAMPGILYRSRDPLSGFETGPTLFDSNMRHAALRIRRGRLQVFFSRVGDTPEQILYSEIELAGDWSAWRESEPVPVLAPERDYEGAGLALEPSVRGLSMQPVRQLRDPALFEDDGRWFLLYSVAGESGIAIARLEEN